MKKALIYLIIFIILCILGDYGIDSLVYKQIDKQSPYNLAFSSIGANFLESRMYCWAKINANYTQNDPLNNIQICLKGLEIPYTENNLTKESSNGQQILQYECNHGSRNYTILAEQDTSEYNLLITIVTVGEENDQEKIENKLRALSAFSWKFYYLYSGNLDFPADTESRKQIIEVILANMKAEQQEMYEDEYINSITAYCPNLGNTLSIQGRRYNLQIAVRTIGDKETMVYIGHPLILGNY